MDHRGRWTQTRLPQSIPAFGPTVPVHCTPHSSIGLPADAS